MRLTAQAKKILDSQVKMFKDINNFKDDEIIITFLMENKNLDTINLKLKTKNDVTQTSYIFKDEILANYLKDKLDSSNQYACSLSDIESQLLDIITLTKSEISLIKAITTTVTDFKFLCKFCTEEDNKKITFVAVVSDDFSIISEKEGYLIVPEVLRFKFNGEVLPNIDEHKYYTKDIIRSLISNNE